METKKIKFRYGIYHLLADDYGYLAIDRSLKKREHNINIPKKLQKYMETIMRNHRTDALEFTYTHAWENGLKYSTIMPISPKDRFVKQISRATTKKVVQIVSEIMTSLKELGYEHLCESILHNLEWFEIEKGTENKGIKSPDKKAE